MGPPGRGHLEGRGRAGGYYFWARGTRTPPYGVTAVWCPYRCASRSHSVSDAWTLPCRVAAKWSLAMLASLRDLSCV